MDILKDEFSNTKTNYELTEWLYSHFPMSFLSTVIIAAILYFELLGYVPTFWLNVWFISFWIIILARGILMLWYNKTKHNSLYRPYHYPLFIVGVYLTAILWGVLGSVLMPKDILHQAFILILISGILAGASQSLSGSYIASIGYLIISLVPILFWEVLQIQAGRFFYIGVLVTMVLYFVFALIVIKTNFVAFRNNIRLKHQNFHLLKLEESHNHQIELLIEMNEHFQRAESDNEILIFAAQFVAKIFLKFSGGFYLINDTQVIPVKVWRYRDRNFLVHDCLALRNETVYIYDGITLCKHVENKNPKSLFYICFPIKVADRVIGLFHIQNHKKIHVHDYHLMHRIAKEIEAAISNLRIKDMLKNQATHDLLTGLFNRRFFVEFLNMAISKANRHHTNLILIMLDIDHFKTFNDTFGHDIGDRILLEVGRLLHNKIRLSDIACRYGGEEFFVIMPDTSLNTGLERVEELRQEAKHISIATDKGVTPPVIFSCGIAEFPTHGVTAGDLIIAADKALYQAKKEGRDRIQVSINQE